MDKEDNSNDLSSDDELDAGCDVICGDIRVPPPPQPNYDQDGRRLVITQIQIYNFKSYGGTRILGPFHKSFTAIVGPNGSGKSNVIDAMLFVFGYRAQKLRLKKLSLLIHNSDTFPNCTSCSVKVFFASIYDKLDDKLDIIDGSEFSISRTAHKDNSSYYCIDDRRVQFKEVSNRLQSHGIDLRYNRFLILQGEVEQISLMKPKAETEGEAGMLEFLEDIIGTTRLKAPLEKVNGRINGLNMLRAEKINRCKLVQKEKDALESVKNEAITYLKLENSMIRKQGCLFELQKKKALAVLEEVQKDFKEASKNLSEGMQGISDIKERQAAKQKDCDELSSQHETLAKKLESMNENYRSLEKEGEQNRCKNTNTLEKGKKIIADKVEIEKMLKEAQAELITLDEQIERDKQTHMELQASLSKADEELSKVRGTLWDDLKPMRDTREKYEASLMAMQAAINEAKNALVLKKSHLDQYLLPERQEESKLKSLESELKSDLLKLEERRKLLGSCQADLPESERRIASNLKRVKTLESTRKDIQTKLDQEKQILIEAKAIAQESMSKNRVLTKIMEQSKSGAIQGIYGRLGDLATIDKKYDTAMSTFAAGHLDKILVANVETGKKCIEYLKKNSIGSATFSALDQKQKYRHNDFDFNYPAERLIDLIEVQDERYIPAFSDFLGDTLVVESSEIANKIAYSGRGWTVVTLKGHVFRSYGVISGGGRPITGKMRTTSGDRRSSIAAGMSQDDIFKTEDRVRNLESELINVTAEYEKLQAESTQASKENELIKNQLPELQWEVEMLGKKVQSQEKEIAEQKVRFEKVKTDAGQISTIENEIESLQENFDKLKAEEKVIEEQIAEVDRQIEAFKSSKSGPAEREVSKLTKEMKEISTAISDAEKSKKNKTRTVEKCQEKIVQYKEEVHQSNEILAQLKARRHEIRGEIDSLDKERQSVSEELETISERVKTEQAELNKLKQEENKFKATLVDIEHKVDVLAKKVSEREAEVNRWTNMIQSLKPNSMDGLNLDDELDEEDEEEPGDEKMDDDSDQDINQLQKMIEHLDKEMKKIRPNLGAIEEYRQKHALYIERTKELDAVTRQRDEHREAYENLKNMRIEEFKQGFMVINRKLKEMYRMITLGGDAELEYCDSFDPFLEGIAFSVRPNKKTWKRISNLSGGEKTLSSLALIFALHYYKPSPLYVMDEIDAALDFKNVSIVGNYIKERTKNTQFLIISLRNNMYELSDRLIGIYKTYNTTKSLPYSLV